MLIAYKVIISLVTVIHILGFAMGVFMPAEMAKEFGVEFTPELQRTFVHFGILLGIFSVFLAQATYWTFKGKAEGIHLGLLAGIGMTAAFFIDIAMVGGEMDYMLLVMGLLTTGTAYMAGKSSSEASE
ncbi:MAG: hypothetical protein COB85_03230 [Bacteroidetes bacterium]|nr:MAG: hypothetical protein COB85_03230 [Bacteroidota bacterium]